VVLGARHLLLGVGVANACVDIDDLYFATRSGTPGGRIDWADFARLTVYDLVERNGRFSDMMVQLAMAMGGWIRVPLILSSVSASLAL